MKVQEVLLRVTIGRLTWGQATEFLGLSDRRLRRWRERYEADGYDGCSTAAGRRSVPSACRGGRCSRC